jgi:hypothetical protein
MADQQLFDQKIEELKSELRKMKNNFSEPHVEETAIRLERLNYAPPIILPVEIFLRLTNETLLAEIEKILAMPDQTVCELAPDKPDECRDLRIQFITVLIFYYKQLTELRSGNVEAWDEVDEMYVHD